MRFIAPRVERRSLPARPASAVAFACLASSSRITAALPPNFDSSARAATKQSNAYGRTTRRTAFQRVLVVKTLLEFASLCLIPTQRVVFQRIYQAVLST